MRTSEQRVKTVFDHLWAEESVKKRTFAYRIFSHTIGRFNSTRYLFKIMAAELKDLGKTPLLLETGCGKGNAAVLLAKHRPFLKQHLLDISPGALKITKKNLEQNGATGQEKFILGSLFEVPMPDDSYDVIWSEGVLEHFSQAEQIAALKEAMRLLKPSGKIVIIVPNARAVLYKLGMAHAIQKGYWEYGYEQPLITWYEIVAKIKGLRIRCEYSRGFINQFGFLRYFFYRNRISRGLFQITFSLFQCIFYPFNYFPGYYLITVIEKENS